MPRISQLPSLTTADNADEIAIVDVSASATKRITRGDLFKSPLPTNSVTTAAVADNAITADKLDFTTFQAPAEKTGTNGTGQNNIAIVNLTYNFIAGKKYLIIGSASRIDRSAAGVINTALRIDSAILGQYRTFGGNNVQVGVCIPRLYIPSTSGIKTIDLYASVFSGGTGFDYELPTISVIPLHS